MERGTDRIRLESSTHGQYECRASDLDVIIAQYSGYTIAQLQSMIESEEGYEHGSYKINSRVEGFMILAELRGYATN